MTKSVTVAVLAMLLPLAAGAQVRFNKSANRITYWQFDYGERTDTAEVVLEQRGGQVRIVPQEASGATIEGYADRQTMIDYEADSITVSVAYPDGDSYYYRTPLRRDDIEWQRDELAGGHVRYTCSINSNTLVFEMDERAPVCATPLPYYGLAKGVLVSFTRNGQTLLRLASAAKLPKAAATEGGKGVRVSPRELERIVKERLVVTRRIFDNEQVCWGKRNDSVAGVPPMDSVLHFAGGTVILKRVTLPRLPRHYQYFLELHQQSAGDAYDRTGSVFVVTPGFFEGINGGVDRLPRLVGRDGEVYQGVAAVPGYEPAAELMRFFTPFGVRHFNERMRGEGIEWRPEAYYKQEVTDMAGLLQGEVTIGLFIGNYDAGGHRVTLDIKAYPGSYDAGGEGAAAAVPLFNTCNVLEMAAQNYGKLFATDTLAVSFSIEPGAHAPRLRYISTGHGGWGEGDEFVPKQNVVLIDGKVAFVHTPWRGDCGTHRDLNPVSGNFWNGLSSSDLSRSGWCPGTATQPVYFDLSPWADGKRHTLQVAIPQGRPVEGMFSHWCVSGCIVTD
ncbi:MAG: hypothetical protein IJ760_01560 [Bacteroidales bacterium]|nr:hypothetical protein [Bacteroidales bacterium]